MAISVVIITFNEETNLRRTLESVMPLVRPREGMPDTAGEIIVVDNGSTDRTVEIAREFGAKVFVEEWKGYAAQKNSAMEKASCDWVLSLDADEEIDSVLQTQILFLIGQADESLLEADGAIHSARFKPAESFQQLAGEWAGYAESFDAFRLRRKNLFLGRWIKHAGFYPDSKIRLFKRGTAKFADRAVHETMVGTDKPLSEVETLQGNLLHHTYPTLSNYIATMNRYSSLGAEIAVGKGHGRFSFLNIVIRPLATFVSMYLLKAGFLDGREGLLLCLYHSVYVSWKYAKAWELARGRRA